MTNPNNSVGTNAAYDGRTSVNAFNDVLGLLPRGVLSGWACVPNSGLTVSVGGVSGTRDVAIAEDNNGNRTTINNIPGTPIDVTMSAAPGANSRIDLIVAYVDNPPTGVSTTADNPATCGLITVEGTAAATPTAPDDSDIRTAITADGASGTTAYYVVLAQVTIPTGTTDIDNSMISSGGNSGIRSQNIDFTASTDSNGWTRISLSNNVNLYMKKAEFSDTWTADSWNQRTASTKPIGLNISNTFFGGAGGIGVDHAVNVCGFVQPTNAQVEIQTQNIYNGSVTTTVFWWAYIVEIL